MGYTLGFLVLNQFLSMLTFKNCKKLLQFVMWNDFPGFLTCIFLYSFPIFTPGKQPYFEISEMITHTPCARGIWWTLDFASAFLSPGGNSRAELVPSPRAFSRNGAPRHWLGDNTFLHNTPLYLQRIRIYINIGINYTIWAKWTLF
jgi:hypothetical protein